VVTVITNILWVGYELPDTPKFFNVTSGFSPIYSDNLDAEFREENLAVIGYQNFLLQIGDGFK